MGRFYLFTGNGLFRLGRDAGNDIVVDDIFVSREHLIICPEENGNTAIVKIKGRNGAEINKCQYGQGSTTCIGKSDTVVIGNLIFMWLGKWIYIGKSCRLQSEIGLSDHKNMMSLIVNRRVFAEHIPRAGRIRSRREFVPTIRQIRYVDDSPITIEAPPARKLPEKVSVMFAAGPALTMAIPILLGCGRVLSIVSSVLAGTWAAANVLGRHRKLKTDERRRRNSYIAYIEECEACIKSRCTQYVNLYNELYPPICTYLPDAGNPFLLWNRNLDSQDMWRFRVGTGDCDFPVSIDIPKDRFNQIDDSLREFPAKLKNKYKKLENVPIYVDVGCISNLGIVCEDAKCGTGVLRAMMLQMFVGCMPNQLRVSVEILNEKYDDISYAMRFCPHYINKDDVIRNIRNSANNEEVKYMIITDSTEYALMFRECNCATVIIIKSAITSLPSYVESIVFVDRFRNGYIKENLNTEKITDVRFDQISDKLFDEYVRKIAGLWGNRSLSTTDIPEKVDYGEIYSDFAREYGVSNIMMSGHDCIEKMWENHDAVKELNFPIGIGTEGRTIYLDLIKNGPHGIVAGTTGSGKSELLTTMILSACMMYAPDKLGFFLIDYKGGGMANLFSGLPHLLGSISNLSVTESARAMISVRSENMRRQTIFNEAGVNNIGDYIKLYDAEAVKEPLPHVLIIIDEFAELKKEQPDFMQELISVAAVGRSLGVHLILATQKPGGVVDDKIRSNSRFRICLRVESKSDSNDMLKKPDAADITDAGRAYLQVGNDEVYEYFQSGYAMSMISDTQADDIDVFDDNMTELCGGVSDNEEYQMTLSWHEHVMNEIKVSASDYSYLEPQKLWLPALPEIIREGSSVFSGITDKQSCYAIADCPALQCIKPLGYDLASDSSMCILGATQTGKSGMINAILISIIKRYTAEEVNIYIIDYGGGRLRQFENSNICGGYITCEEDMRIPMLINYIREIVEERRRLLAKSAELADQKKIVLVIDNYAEAVKNHTESVERDLIIILKYGKTTGVNVIFAAQGTGSGEIPMRMTDMMQRIIVLGRTDTYQSATIFKIHVKQIPMISDCSGRGITLIENSPLEIQGIYYDDNEITDVIKYQNTRNNSFATIYPYIPSPATVDDFLRRILQNEHRPRGSLCSMLPAGYEETTGKIHYVNLKQITCIMISGPEGSGRKSLISFLETVAARIGIEVLYAYTSEALIYTLKMFEERTGQNAVTDQNHTILIVPKLGRILCEFYDYPHSAFDEELLSKYVDNSAKACKTRHISIVGIVTDDMKMGLVGKALMKSIMRKPYAICMGGNLSDQRLFDCSYLPYSVQSRKKNPGRGTVLKYNSKMFYGDIIIPKFDWMEEE